MAARDSAKVRHVFWRRRRPGSHRAEDKSNYPRFHVVYIVYDNNIVV